MVSLIERSDSVELDEPDEQDDAEMRLEQELIDQDQDQDDEQLPVKRNQRQRRSRNGSAAMAASPDLGELDQELDEEQLKRILGCKRLSEGNCAGLNLGQRHHLANICRKNSLHMIGESLPPVTEGEPMRHMSHHMSQNMEGGPSSSSASSASLRGGGLAGRQLVGGNKRNSQDENATTCSSSTSLDGGSSAASRSPTRRRSSTVSQCSSVLSEGTRQQLNFDLSPDLPPDSSILEANAMSPSEFERPASPEPSSLDSMGDYEPHSSESFDLMLRPVSRISDCAQFNLSSISDAEQSETTPMTVSELERCAAESPDFQKATHLLAEHHLGEADQNQHQHQHQHQNQQQQLASGLERIITNVSEVKVSSNQTMPVAGDVVERFGAEANTNQRRLSAGQKRAHTPFGGNCQRNKASHIEQVGDP